MKRHQIIGITLIIMGIFLVSIGLGVIPIQAEEPSMYQSSGGGSFSYFLYEFRAMNTPEYKEYWANSVVLYFMSVQGRL